MWENRAKNVFFSNFGFKPEKKPLFIGFFRRFKKNRLCTDTSRNRNAEVLRSMPVKFTRGFTNAEDGVQMRSSLGAEPESWTLIEDGKELGGHILVVTNKYWQHTMLTTNRVQCFAPFN